MPVFYRFRDITLYLSKIYPNQSRLKLSQGVFPCDRRYEIKFDVKN